MKNDEITKKYLLEMWEKNKDLYKKREIGSGLESYIRKVLICDKTFGLREISHIDKIQNYKKGYFVNQESTKKRNTADFVLYLDKNIIIPVEVEKYKNIVEGESQIIKYQSDLNKKFGILTDGNEWRFYNNNKYKTFYLQDIISEKDKKFKIFWDSYVKSKNYYLDYFRIDEKHAQYQNTHQLRVKENLELFFTDIVNLIDNFKYKLELSGYFEDDKNSDKVATEITYAYIIQFILYKSLVDNSFTDFKNEYKVFLRRIRGNIEKDNYKGVLSIVSQISDRISKEIYRPFINEQDIINNKFYDLFRQIDNSIDELEPWLDIIIFITKYSFINIETEIFGYIYENYLKEIYGEKKLGQYFTHPDVVDFMLDEIGFSKELITKSINENQEGLSIIDPSCGSGSFLYKAASRLALTSEENELTEKEIIKLVVENIFGLDIAELPLYLAEMNIIMRLITYLFKDDNNLQIKDKLNLYKTKDSLYEFYKINLQNTSVEVEQEGFQEEIFEDKIYIDSFMRDDELIDRMKKSMKEPGRIRFDFVIGNPPYIGYNQASSKLNLLIFDMIGKNISLKNFYGLNLYDLPDEKKTYAPKPNVYVMFIALGISLLKDNGVLAYIIPQTFLTSHDIAPIRYELAKKYSIEEMIVFKNKMFIKRGLHQNKKVPTSSMIIKIRRKKSTENSETIIKVYNGDETDISKCIEEIQNKKNIYELKIKQKEMLEHVHNWKIFTLTKNGYKSYKNYMNTTDGFDRYFIHQKSKSLFGDEFYIDGGAILTSSEIHKDKQSENDFLVVQNDKVNYNRFNLELSSRKYFDINNVKYPEGSQGQKVYRARYKIIWRINDPNIFQFTDEDIVIDNNQSLLISSNNYNEIIYLLFLLNSELVQDMLRMVIQIENENKYYLSITKIKENFRVPKITQQKIKTKNKLINNGKKILELEKEIVKNLIKIPDSLFIQEFNEYKIENNVLIISKGNDRSQFKIVGEEEVLQRTIDEFLSKNGEKHTYLTKSLLGHRVSNTKIIQQLLDKNEKLVNELYNI